MSTSRALEDLARAASAAGYAMASVDDDSSIVSTVPVGEEVARGGRIPTASSMIAALPSPTHRPAHTEGKGLVAGAQHIRETVFGYLGFRGATA